MRPSITHTVALGFLFAGCLSADFTYEETSQITGGALVGMMKFAGAFSKDARRAGEPTHSTIAIKGNRMVRKNDLTATITDLDAETITTINFERKTYWTMTFAQMKQAMANASAQMEQAKTNSAPSSNGAPPPDMKFDVKVSDTGQTKTINGLPAHEMIVTMTMQGTDQQSGAQGGMDVTTDSWLTPNIPGYGEVRAFYRRMAEKLNWVPGPGGLMNRPDISRGMAELYKEGAKMDGVPVLQLVKMGGSVQNVPQNSDSANTSNQSQSSSSSSPPPTSVGGALGSALGGRFGLGRKKSQPQNSDSSTNSSNSSNSGNASGSLLEMTVQLTTYSSAQADMNLFTIPANFKLVDPETAGRRAH